MKRILFILLILVTCFNLAGGYTYAATVISQANALTATDGLQNSSAVPIVKKSTFDIHIIQINKDDSEDEELFVPKQSFPSGYHIYSYIPDFKLLNKHFLLHYGRSIKDKGLSAYILHQNFRL